jgi:PEGA domain-containing protein
VWAWIVGSVTVSRVGAACTVCFGTITTVLSVMTHRRGAVEARIKARQVAALPVEGSPILAPTAEEVVKYGHWSGRPIKMVRNSTTLLTVFACLAWVAGGPGEKVSVQHEVAERASPALPPPSPALPAAPTTGTVRVESDPPGAIVINVATGELLGSTPLVLTRPRGTSIKFRLEKDGFVPNAHEVSLDDDQTIDLTLEHQPGPMAHVRRRHPRERDVEDAAAKL